MVQLSVIVPVYNVESYLKRCVDSILEQTFEEFEVILVDDGSLDNSSEICNKYSESDKRVKVIHKKNGGLSSARNAGLNIAKGEYIAFIDSDDYVSKDMFKTMINLALSNNYDIVSCGFKRFYENSCNEPVCRGTIYKYSNIEALSNYLLEYDNVNRKIDTVVWNKIYKRELFNDITFPEGKIYEDGYVTYKLLYKANNIAHIDDELYYYFQRQDSISNSGFSENDVKSYDDWRDIFRFVYINANSLSSLAGNKYIKKNINMYIKICKYKRKNNNSQNYKRSIRSDLMEDFKKLIKLDINKESKLELRLFMINYRLVMVSRKLKQIIGQVRSFMSYKILRSGNVGE